MNLFLLTAVPLAAVALHRLLHPSRPPFADVKSWILGSVWALVALVAAAFFGGWRTFTGDLWAISGGLVVTDVVLVPGVVVAAWVLTRPQNDPWELALWLTLVFTLAGVRDFASASRVFDLNELFLVPLDRILLILAAPALLPRIFGARIVRRKWAWLTVAGLLALTGALFPLLSFTNLGWLAWLLEIGGITTFMVWGLKGQKKAASESGSVVSQ